MDFAEATAWCAQGALAALFTTSGLNMERPVDPLNPTPKGKKILIWGGASSYGALGITYAKQAGYTVISTSSPHNFPLLKEQGADYIFDYNDPATLEKIRELFPIDYYYNPASKPAAVQSIIDLLSPPGKEIVKADVLMLMPPSIPIMPKHPEGITAKMFMFRNKAEENQEFVKWMVGEDGYIGRGLRGGWIKGVPVIRVGGLHAVSGGIDMMAKGVSGGRIVVEPWNDE